MTTSKTEEYLSSIKKGDTEDVENELKHNFYFLFKEKRQWKIAFEKDRIIEILRENGYYIYQINPRDPEQYIKVTDKIVELIPKNRVKYFFQDYIRTLQPLCHTVFEKDDEGEKTEIEHEVTPEDLHKQFIKSASYIFDQTTYSLLRPPAEMAFMADNKKEKYLFYKNTVVIVSREGIKTMEYSALPCYVWKTQIMNRDFHPSTEWQLCNFNKFLKVVSGDDKRYECMQTFIGYICHSYEHKVKYCIVLLDSKLNTEDENPKGRSGKSIIQKAIGRLLNPNFDNNTNFVMIDGKQIIPNDPRSYDRADGNTTVLSIDDIHKKYTHTIIEDLFFMITEGVTVKQNYLDKFKAYPTILLAANRALFIPKGSARARIRIFEVSDYFNEVRTPFKEYGEMFFSHDWDAAKWNDFDNTMIHAIYKYFEKGEIIEPPSISFEERMIYDSTCVEFVDFMDALLRGEKVSLMENGQMDMYSRTFSLMISSVETVDHEGFLRDGTAELNKRDFYNAFTSMYPNFAKDKYAQQRFSNWINIYVENNETIICTTRKSNGMAFITFFRKNEQTLTSLFSHNQKMKEVKQATKNKIN